MGIKLTDKAIKEINKIIEEQELDKNNTSLRVGIRGGGCSGWQFLLDLTEVKRDNDEVFKYGNIQVVCDPKSYIYLDGTTIDFKDELMGRGFTFDVPQSTGKCGCGSSMSF